MPRILTVTSKILTILNTITICDASGREVYSSSFKPFTIMDRTFGVKQGGTEVATLYKKIFSVGSVWEVSSGKLGKFNIHKSLNPFLNAYKIKGGSYNGARVHTNALGLKFRIRDKQKELAKASGTIVSIRDSHSIEMLSDDPQDELLVAICLITLHISNKYRAEAKRSKIKKKKDRKKGKKSASPLKPLFYLVVLVGIYYVFIKAWAWISPYIDKIQSLF